MSKIEKLILQFSKKPENLQYRHIVKILKYLNFEMVKNKGSHVRFQNQFIKIIVPVHNGECKNAYKKEIYKKIKDLIKIL